MGPLELFFSHNISTKYPDQDVREQLPDCRVNFVSSSLNVSFDCKDALSWMHFDMRDGAEDVRMQICRYGNNASRKLENRVNESPVCSKQIRVHSVAEAHRYIRREVDYEESRAHSLNCDYKDRMKVIEARYKAKK